MPFKLSWRPGGSVGFLINLFGFFELTMVAVRGREVCWTSGTLRRGPRVRCLLTAHLILGIILLQSEGLLCTLWLLSVAIAGAGDILHMPVALKALNVRNVVVLIELRTTDCWLGVARPILSLTLLGR